VKGGKAMAKQASKKTGKSDVSILQEWVEDEMAGLKDDCALEVLELLKGEDPDRFKRVQDKIATCQENVQALINIQTWCQND
jgi:hypothetical protein